jgi:hypothetical protein
MIRRQAEVVRMEKNREAAVARLSYDLSQTL